MISSNTELYEKTQELIAILKNKGDIEGSNKLKNALGVSMMPSEILGEIRMAAKEILQVYNDEYIQEKAEEIVGCIDNSFRQ